MRHICIAMLSMAVLAACGDSGQPLAPAAPLVSATTTVTNERVPFSTLQFVSCANEGAGEEVLLEGTLHQLARATESAGGTFSITIHENPQGVSGTGLTTGDKYQGTGSFTLRGTMGPGETFTVTSSFLVVGPGPDNNFTVHETFHYTVNANGEVTSEVDNFSVSCS
ncbi:MAG: hypothetical protein ABW277_21080 [Longimicrobiaceae bacterium]